MKSSRLLKRQGPKSKKVKGHLHQKACLGFQCFSIAVFFVLLGRVLFCESVKCCTCFLEAAWKTCFKLDNDLTLLACLGALHSLGLSLGALRLRCRKVAMMSSWSILFIRACLQDGHTHGMHSAEQAYDTLISICSKPIQLEGLPLSGLQCEAAVHHSCSWES